MVAGWEHFSTLNRQCGAASGEIASLRKSGVARAKRVKRAKLMPNKDIHFLRFDGAGVQKPQQVVGQLL
jgi:hypothetical protein